MYISLLDYLEEVKKKYYIILITFVVFFLVSFSFKYYKDNFYSVSFSSNLIKLSSLSIQNINLRTDTAVAIKWISDEATKRYDKINKNEFLPMKCESEDHFISCVISGKFENNIEEVKNNMTKSVTGAFEQYQFYFIDLIDTLIKSKEDTFSYVINSEDTTIDVQASAKNAVEEAIFAKQIFETTLSEAKLDILDISVKKHRNSVNYILILISSLICSLFIIFIQMKSKKSN